MNRLAAWNPPWRHLPSIAAGALRWRIRSLDDVPWLSPLLENPDAFLVRRELRFKHSNIVTVARVPALAEGTPDLVLRRLNYGRRMHRLRDAVRATRVERSFARGLALEAAGIPTPTVFAVGVERRWRWPVRAYLLTREVGGARTLENCAKQTEPVPEILIQRLAACLGQLHTRHFSHRDLKGSNVLVDPQLHPWLIDLDGVRIRPVGVNRAGRDLALLGDSVLSHPSFLSGYCQARGWTDRLQPLAEKIRALRKGR